MSINITKKINLKKEENLKINNNQIDLDWLEKKNQIIFLNQLFLNENLSSPHLYLKKELTKKLNSYINQDKSKNIHEDTSSIILEELVVKLIESKLKCHYCQNDVKLIYDKKLQQNQWTLDRLDNFKGHNNDNTVVSCLKCNIQRGRINNKKFLFTKQLTIKKSN